MAYIWDIFAHMSGMIVLAGLIGWPIFKLTAWCSDMRRSAKRRNELLEQIHRNIRESRITEDKIPQALEEIHQALTEAP